MNKAKIIMFGMFLLLVSQASALVKVDMDIESSFSIGEKVGFNYSLLSDSDERIVYVASISCPGVRQDLLKRQVIELKPNVSYKNNYSSFKVDESVEPQTCEAQISILEPYELTRSKSFKIIARPSFSFSIDLNKKVFIKGEEVNLDYSSGVKGVDVNGTLFFPGGKEKNLIFPVTMELSEIGEYEVKMKASKENYKVIESEESFEVIEENADIKKVSLEKKYWILILIICVLVFLIVFVGFFYFKKRKENSFENSEKSI